MGGEAFPILGFRHKLLNSIITPPDGNRLAGTFSGDLRPNPAVTGCSAGKRSRPLAAWTGSTTCGWSGEGSGYRGANGGVGMRG
jgi:hypothetical protein